MGLPSGTFSHPASGRLQVTFRGKWLTNAGNDWGSGTLNLYLRAYVGAGGARKTAMLSLASTTAVIDVAYTGGTEVPVGLEYAAHQFSGPSAISAADLECVCRLLNT